MELSRTMSVSSVRKARDQKIHMRKILVKGILESERTYLSLLKDITEVGEEYLLFIFSLNLDTGHLIMICLKTAKCVVYNTA